MNPLRRLDSVLRAHPVWVDSVVAVLILAVLGLLVGFSVGDWSQAAPVYIQEQVLTLVLVAGQVLPWAIRRVWPVTSAGLIAFFCLLELFVGPEFLPSLIMVPATVHNLAVRAPRWAARGGLGLALFGAVANGIRIWLWPRGYLALDGTVYPVEGPDLSGGVMVAVLCTAVTLAAWAFGDLARTRRIALEQLQDRARQLEAEALQERQLAAADERTHIAREMHDIVAHSLQVIITQADGGRYAGAKDPEVAVQTLGTVAETGRQALGEMRRLLGVLRGPEQTELRPQPGLSDVPGLVEGMRTLGLPVTHEEQGAARRGLPTGSELAAYRVIQEALTNTARHGGPSVQAELTLRWTAAGLEITVDDDGRGAAASAETAGSRQGLIGMQERVTLFGGTVRAGPRLGGGFRVHAALPYAQV